MPELNINIELNDIAFSVSSTLKEIKNLICTKSCGPDNVSAYLIHQANSKFCIHTTATIISDIFL